MNYGLYLSANGVLSSLHRQDVLANNLANAETVGFKPDLVYTRQRPTERLESGMLLAEPMGPLEQLGGGHFVQPTRVDFRSGHLNRTDNPLDFAVAGEGLFLVSAGAGAGPDHLRLSRDGRMTISRDGELVMSSTGMKVLDVDRRPIRLDPSGDVSVDRSGTIRQGGEAVARLALVRVEPEQVHKAGHNLLRVPENATTALPPASGLIRQGYVETSAVDPIMTLNKLIGATKAAQANAKLMQYHDFIMGQVINTMGRVA